MSTECYAISFYIDVVNKCNGCNELLISSDMICENRKYFAEISLSDNDPLLLTKKCISCMIYFLVCSFNKCVFYHGQLLITQKLYTPKMLRHNFIAFFLEPVTIYK